MIQEYDSDKKFPVFGFGGVPKFAGGTSVSDCFNLSGVPDPEVDGVQGILYAYQRAIAGT